jgi:hypothetical protein
MNRRSFFRSLSSAVAGIYVACHVNLAELTNEPASALVENPNWVNAEYEIHFVGSPWLSILDKAPFPKGMGETIKAVK